MRSARTDYMKFNARGDNIGIQSAKDALKALDVEDKAETNKPEEEAPFGFQPAAGGK